MPSNESALSFGVRIARKAFWRAAWTPRMSAIKREVELAYRDRNSRQASKLRAMAQTAWGIREGNTERSKEYIRLAHLAQEELAHSGMTLDAAPLGFEDLKVNVYCTDVHSSRIYLDGFDESANIFSVYRRTARPGSAVLDVGANSGTHSLVMSRLVGDAGRVYAYEPNPVTARRLEANITLNKAENVVVRQVGAGNACGKVRFNDVAGQFNSGFARIDPDGSIEIPVTTIDADYTGDRAVSVVKIDVEGFELEVLGGAQRLLEKHMPSVILECNEWTYQDLARVIPYPFKLSMIPLNPLKASEPLEWPYRMGHIGSNMLVEPLVN